MKPHLSISAGGVVMNPEGKIVLVSHKGVTLWGLPKGHIDEGEDALIAAQREIYEETGIADLQMIRELGSYERYRVIGDGQEDVSERKRMIMFFFKTKTTTLKPIDSDNPEAIWLTPKDAVEKLTHPKDKAFLRSVLDKL